MRPTEEGLVRYLGAFGAGAFVVTNMIGSGIFTVPAFVRAATGGAVASLLVWLAAGLLGLCGALCYAELATRMPCAGGEYRFLAREFGPLWGFLSGWTSFVVGFSAAVAASALGVVAYAERLLPGWDAAAPLGWSSQRALAASALVMALTVVHCLGVRSSGRFQAALAALVVLTLYGLVVVGFASGRGEMSGLVAEGGGGGSWWVALLQVSYAYAGWNAAAYLAGEVRSPARNLPRALVAGTAFVILTYLLVNAVLAYALPEPDWQPSIAVAQLAAERLFGSAGAVIVSGAIALAMLGSVSAMTAVGPRVYFAMARDGLAPAMLGRVSRGGRVPVGAIAAQGLLASLLALTGAFEVLLVYIGSSLLLFNALTVAALVALRRREGAPAAGRFRTPAYPLPALAFLATTAAAWINGLRSAPLATGSALATLALGAGVYGLGRRAGRLG